MSNRYTKEMLNSIWNKATVVPGYDPDKYRQDACGAWIINEEYNNRKSPFGWEVDHIFPESKLLELNVPEELINDIVNLQPLNWLNNTSKGNDYPSYQSKVKADGEKNIINESQFIVNRNKLLEIKNLYAEYLPE